MQSSVDSIRKAVNKRQEELKVRQRSPIRTPKISHPSSVRRSEASAASSKAEKMEAERLKAKMLREKEIEQKKIDNELKIQARQREIQQQQQQMEAEKRRMEDEKRRIEDEQQQLQDEIEREKREMEAELQKQLLDAEAEDAIRQIDINQARVNGSRSSNASVRSVLSLPDQSENQVNTWLNNNPGVSQQQPPAINSSSQHSMTTPAVAGASNSFGLFSGVTQSINKPIQTFSSMKQSNFGSSNANMNQIPSPRSGFPNTNNQQTNFAGQRSRDRSPVHPRSSFYNTPSVTFDPNVFYSKPPVAPMPRRSMNLPKLKLFEFSGDPLDWPEWSGLFTAIVDEADITDAEKMHYLKTTVTGKARDAIAGLGFSGEMYQQAWANLELNFGRPAVIVNAQMKRIYSFPPIRHEDSAAIIKFSKVISNTVNVLTQFGYTNDLGAENVLNVPLRKFPQQLKERWLTYLHERRYISGNIMMLNEWLLEKAMVHEDLLSQTGGDRPNKFQKEGAKANSFAANVTRKQFQPKCPFCNEEHNIWACDTFKKQSVEERRETIKNLKRCYLCLRTGHGVKDCKMRPCDIDGCGKKHNKMLHQSHIEENSAEEEASNVASAMKIVKENKGTLPVIKVRVRNGENHADVWALSDSGSTISMIDEALMNDLDLKGENVKLSLAGINATEDRKCRKYIAKIKSLENKSALNVTPYSHKK